MENRWCADNRMNRSINFIDKTESMGVYVRVEIICGKDVFLRIINQQVQLKSRHKKQLRVPRLPRYRRNGWCGRSISSSVSSES